jgi:thiosulfate/3-mercaptopyruvate sulfurtransferase
VDNTLVRGLDRMTANLENRREQVVDARSPGRFAGKDPEPRPTRRQGHIPGSFNVPVGAIMDPARGFALRPAAEIAAAFDRDDRPVEGG